MNISANATSLNSNVSAKGLQNVCMDTPFTRASAKVFALSVIMVVSLIGNILIVFVVYKNHNLRRTINFFIVNIALSDLIIPILVIPRMIVENLRADESWLLDPEGVFGQISCKFVLFLSDVSPTVSIVSLIFMTVDRFLAVVFPLRVTLMNSKRRYCLIALTWIISAGVFAPYFYGVDIIQDSRTGKYYCKLLWSRHLATHWLVQKAFSSAVSIIFLVIPFFTLTILYSIILIKARKTPDLIRNKTCAGEKARLKQKQTAKRVTLMAFLIVLIFGLCWGPYNIFLFLLTFVWNWQMPRICQWHTFVFIVKFLCFSNAAINPCVYFILIKNFRRGLTNQLSKSRRSKQKHRSKNLQSESLLTSLRTSTVKATNCSSAETCI